MSRGGLAGLLAYFLVATGDREQMHHGEGIASWAVSERALHRGHGMRTGLEDVLVLPDGQPAPEPWPTLPHPTPAPATAAKDADAPYQRVEAPRLQDEGPAFSTTGTSTARVDPDCQTISAEPPPRMVPARFRQVANPTTAVP